MNALTTSQVGSPWQTFNDKTFLIVDVVSALMGYYGVDTDLKVFEFAYIDYYGKRASESDAGRKRIKDDLRDYHDPMVAILPYYVMSANDSRPKS